MSVELGLRVEGIWGLVRVVQASSVSVCSTPLSSLRCFRIGVLVLD